MSKRTPFDNSRAVSSSYRERLPQRSAHVASYAPGDGDTVAYIEWESTPNSSMAPRRSLLARSLRPDDDQTTVCASPPLRNSGSHISSPYLTLVRSWPPLRLSLDISAARGGLCSTPTGQTAEAQRGFRQHRCWSLGRGVCTGKDYFGPIREIMKSELQLWTGFIRSCKQFPERPATIDVRKWRAPRPSRTFSLLEHCGEARAFLGFTSDHRQILHRILRRIRTR